MGGGTRGAGTGPVVPASGMVGGSYDDRSMQFGMEEVSLRLIPQCTNLPAKRRTYPVGSASGGRQVTEM